MRRTLRGNTRSTEDFDVLESYESELRKSAKHSKITQASWKQDLEDLIVAKLLEMEGEDSVSVYQSSTHRQLLDNNIVYYLSGFLCHKYKTKVCEDCFQTICASAREVQAENSMLTDLLDYGKLQHPTISFFSALISLEVAICQSLAHNVACGDIVLDALKNVKLSSDCAIGCTKSGHSEALALSLFPHYITIRLHFYAKSQRNFLGHGKATKNKRKESKLAS